MIRLDQSQDSHQITQWIELYPGSPFKRHLIIIWICVNSYPNLRWINLIKSLKLYDH